MFDDTKVGPGVYIQEITPTGPIAGTGTSTPAFIGTVANNVAAADIGKPVPVTNWTAFTNAFGGYDNKQTLPTAVRGFFQNGGTFAYIVPFKDIAALDGALTNLQAYADVSLVCLPSVVDPAAQNLVIAHCEKMADRVAILDGKPDTDPLKPDGALQTQKAALTKSSYAALYWPWIQIPDPTAPPDKPKMVSIGASGHIAGLIARSDSQRGVHKAPANEAVIGASDLDFHLDNPGHGTLNNLNINALRVFPGRSQPMVWGARTLSDNVAWRHLNVRRLIAFIEDSLVQGTNWAVFEPNNIGLWKRLELSISEFLTRVWQSGALFGATADQAFYVKIDEELNPKDVQALGQVFGEIGVAPVHPAEYIVFRIGLWDGGAQITET